MFVENYPEIDKDRTKEVVRMMLGKVSTKSVLRSFLIRVAFNEHLDLDDENISRYMNTHKQPYLVEGKIVPIGTKGEICSKGFGVMIGYWEDEQATKDCIDKDGYMKTGDIGHFDEEGYLTIDGRSKDTIIRGGENISPREIEEFLITHPCVEDVHCFAVKDEKYGDEICIWVKKKPGMELDKREIQHFCKGQLAHFKVPKYVRLVDSFPMTITGKVQKYIMRDISNKILEEKSEEM